ncbi:MAG: DUF2510 domain-containing protein [Acidimicrobiia bacterium]|jgi:hypothetical protein
MNEPARPANWYADPTGRHQYRYWNATEWTDQVADNQVTSTDPPTMPEASAATPTAPAPAAPPAPGAPPLAPTLNQPDPRKNANPIFAVVAIIGGVLLAIGSFLDAAKASAGSGAFTFDVEKNYMDGDGPITLVVGIGIVVIGVLLITKAIPRWGGWIALFLGAVGVLVALADIADVSDSPEIEAVGGSITVGPALWVCLAGGIVALVGGGLAALLGRAEAD